MPRHPKFITHRLLLRPFELEDAPVVQRLAGAWEIADTTADMPHPYEDGMAETWIAGHADALKAGESATFAITLADSEQLIGAIGLVLQQGYQGELGYWVGVPYCGNGYCTEAANAMLDFAFRELGLQRIYAHCFARNPASGRVLEKLGMQQEGILRQHFLKWGKPEDLLMYGLMKSEWQANHLSEVL